MNLHEFQAKARLRERGIATPRGEAAGSAESARAAAGKLGGSAWVVKAQIHAGGRGKSGGVKIARSLEEVNGIAASLLGKPLVTYQNAPDGQQVRGPRQGDGQRDVRCPEQRPGLTAQRNPV